VLDPMRSLGRHSSAYGRLLRDIRSVPQAPGRRCSARSFTCCDRAVGGLATDRNCAGSY
jgi:hypothetical protein